MDKVKDFIIDFMSVYYEAMPFIVLGAIIAGILEEMVPQQFMARIVPKNRLLAISLGALLGLIFPMCECGIVPVMRRLLRKGLPLSTCVAYMLAGPIINVVVILSTYVAFHPHRGVIPGTTMVPQFGMGDYVIALRIGLGFVVAVGTALIVDWMARKQGTNALLTPAAAPPPARSLDLVDGDAAPVAKKNWAQRIGNISETALHDFIDISVFLSLGAVLASLSRFAMLEYNIDIAQVSGAYPAVAILIMMGLAVLMCLCSEADAFVAASFTTLHPSAKIAFLVLGPMFDFKLLMMFTRVFKPRLIRVIIPVLFIQVFVYSMIVHYLWGPLHLPLPVGK